MSLKTGLATLVEQVEKTFSAEFDDAVSYMVTSELDATIACGAILGVSDSLLKLLNLPRMQQRVKIGLPRFCFDASSGKYCARQRGSGHS